MDARLLIVCAALISCGLITGCPKKSQTDEDTPLLVHMSDVTVAYKTASAERAISVLREADEYLRSVRPHSERLRNYVAFALATSDTRQALIYRRYLHDEAAASIAQAAALEALKPMTDKSSSYLPPSVGATERWNILVEFVTRLDADLFARWEAQAKAQGEPRMNSPNRQK